MKRGRGEGKPKDTSIKEIVTIFALAIAIYILFFKEVS